MLKHAPTVSRCDAGGVNGAGALLRSGGVTVAKQVIKVVNKKSFDKDALVSYF